jgi:hypothetical protein
VLPRHKHLLPKHICATAEINGTMTAIQTQLVVVINSSVVSVLISVTIDICPTKELLVTMNFARGNAPLS